MARILAMHYMLCIMFLCTLCIPIPIGANKTLEFWVLEIPTGSNATLMSVEGTGGMGTIVVFDNMVYEDANPNSKYLGQATGSSITTTNNSMDGGLQIQSQITFGNNSSYNGSSILFMGTVFTPMVPWEVIVVGGTRYFRGINGYAHVEPGPIFPPIVTFKWIVYI